MSVPGKGRHSLVHACMHHQHNYFYRLLYCSCVYATINVQIESEEASKES